MGISSLPGNDQSAGFRVRRVSWPRDAAALRSLRERVFVGEQGVPADLEWDGLDAAAVHLLAEDHTGRPIGTARLLRTGQIGRMAVLPAWRRRGVGRTLLRALLDIALGEDFPTPWLKSQTSAIGFYRREGFESEGQEFLDANIPHREMRYRKGENR